MVKLNIAGIIDSSTVDYIGKICSVVYLCGCSYRCPWCQNKELVLGEGDCRLVELDEAVKQLKDNYLVDAVCVTGGEPLMQSECIDLLRAVKQDAGKSLKIDTNGSYPDRLKEALPFLDMVTTDIKAPINREYNSAVGIASVDDSILENVKKTLEILRDWGGIVEARTTVVPGLIDRPDQIASIAESVAFLGFKHYTLQQFRPRNTLDPYYETVAAPSLEVMRSLGAKAKEMLPRAHVRIVTQERGFEEISPNISPKSQSI